MTHFTVHSVSSRIRRVTFSNPPVNLVGADDAVELSAVIDRLSADPDVSVVVFDSSTPGYFYNHADLTQLDALLGFVAEDGTPGWVDLARRIASAPFLTIAEIRGRTRGGGDELALAFDLRYASRQHAAFGQLEVGTGLVPGGGGTDRLSRLIGRDRALEAIMSGQDYDADRAEHYGWVTRAVDDAELSGLVMRTAQRIASFDKEAILGAKAQIDRASLPPEADLVASWEEFTRTVTWPGFHARIAAFGALIAERGLEEVEENLGAYLAPTAP
ncbi:enoyl-CoA hydratase/isomerase family protein [Rathayibacter tanaceti]|uniref:Enoyl-CoA hydratase/isomerase family protein n=2 Tax=Rathayibacter tanaceti TaxID=1671680 RepID=A0A166ICM4_9MICO|nr:enoyl-CoA hydratase/isomerase family protein [Rathayibacter tanaceti]KZX22161.1 putative enoyl-CoA hydratase echA8 [Rathayibacter tanaceti]QHC54458.1 enoyl-CoA hydratase/isomerase family protein [Rathayibacter tanaceti]TCO35056.1 enoyl-CoA hydratase/carnithine racemase [Rathayibacter tanaceti]